MKTHLPKTLLLAGILALVQSTVQAETEAELIATLQSGAGAVEKCTACQKLRLTGTAKAVPAIATQLTDERVSQAARYALEGIADPEAAAVLRAALAKTSGALQAGVADSLGWKRDPAAVPLLKPLLGDADAAVASAAAAALGRIADKPALAALQAARKTAPPAVRPAVLEGLLRCAEQFCAAGKMSGAKKIYESLTNPSEADAVRAAAYVGLINCAGKDALARVKSALEGNDAVAQAAALQVAGGIKNPKATRLFAELLPRSQPALQVALLALLRAGADQTALPAVLTLSSSPDAAVRVAALTTLGALGDASLVSQLAQAATATDRAEQKAAQQALASLRHGDVAAALVAQLSTASPGVQAEVIRALTTRDEKSAVPALLQLAGGEPASPRQAALKALNRLADGSHIGALVQLLASAKDEEARAGVLGVFEALAQRLPDASAVNFEPVARGVAAGDFATRQVLLQVCVLFANDSLRTAFRAALADSDPAVRCAAARALCDSRDVALLPDLLTVARETPDAGLRSSAIAGLVRLVTEDAAGLSAAQQTETLAAVFGLASRLEDKRQVLAGLARVPNQTTLALAQKASTDPAVKAEARAALAQISKTLGIFSGPFIQDWLVCGPYRQTGAAGALALFDVPFGPERTGATAEWKAAPRGDQINLAALFPGQENCAAFLKAEILAAEAGDALLLVGSDDGVKAWLNGKVVLANNVDRGDVADQDQATIQLTQGTNTLVLKVTQGGGGWSARARIVGVDGQPVSGLKVSPSAGAPVITSSPLPPPPPPVASQLPARDHFKQLRLSDQFYAEGAYFADFNRDGRLDIVAGPFWFEGPEFTRRHEYRAARAYDPHEYSDNFLTYAGDCNGDGWPDIVCAPFPGKEGFWFENPAGKDAAWKQHLYYPMVGNESPVWGDVNGDGKPELVFCNEGYLGYAGPDVQHPDQPWVFHAVSDQNKRFQRFTHGLGIGDINGDRRVDIVEAAGWWEQPAELKSDPLWTFHPFRFADSGAQMLVCDVNGDGLADLITSWHCHHYGLVWWQQIRKADGAPDWEQHVILPPKPDVAATDLRVSQMHSLALADMNGDGVMDIVTGKRFWAHGPSGDPESDAPAVLLWFETRRAAGGKVDFIPHLIDDNSGVGTQVATADLNGDGRPDVLVGNKKGIFVFIQQPKR